MTDGIHTKEKERSKKVPVIAINFTIWAFCCISERHFEIYLRT